MRMLQLLAKGPRCDDRKTTPLFFGVLVLVLAGALVAPMTAVGDVPPTGKPISGPSPLPETCNLPSQAQGRRHMETEPHLAVNPTDPNNIAVAWAQDFADGIVVGVSHDGGDTWAKNVLPMTSFCAEGTYDSAFNTHISFGPEGRLYVSTWNKDKAVLRTRVTVHVSTDGGDTWSLPVSLEETTVIDLQILDWSWVVADPTRPGTVYATWLMVMTDFNLSIHMRFARSIDGGVTWSAPRDISPAPAGYDRFPPQLVVLPDGSLVNIYLQALACPITTSPCPTSSVMAARSTDQGDTWSTPVEVALREIGVEGERSDDPRVQKLGTGLVNLPAVSSDGTIYYTWSSIEPDHSSKLSLTSSSDGGVTWRTPRVIRESNVPMGATNIAVAPDNRVGVLYYDFRNDVSDDDAATADVWFISAPGGAQGLGAWKEQHVAGPFDILSVPDHVGSNQGIAGAPGGFVSAYTLGAPLSTVGPTDIFFSRLHP